MKNLLIAIFIANLFMTLFGCDLNGNGDANAILDASATRDSAPIQDGGAGNDAMSVDCRDSQIEARATAFCEEVKSTMASNHPNISACSSNSDCARTSIYLRCDNLYIDCCSTIVNSQYLQEVQPTIDSIRDRYCNYPCGVSIHFDCDAGRAVCVDAGHCI